MKTENQIKIEYIKSINEKKMQETWFICFNQKYVV